MNEELKAFRRFRDNAKFDNKSDYYLSTKYIDDNGIIEEILKASEIMKKESKAVGIIKKKKIDVYQLRSCFEMGGLERYNSYLDMYLDLPECHLTYKEYNLLKEVLG